MSTDEELIDQVEKKLGRKKRIQVGTLVNVEIKGVISVARVINTWWDFKLPEAEYVRMAWIRTMYFNADYNFPVNELKRDDESE